MKAGSKTVPQVLIIIVNDDPAMQILQAAMLTEAGYRTVEYSDAERALEGMRDLPDPALIITDLFMPQIDGWRFCRLLRSEEFSRFNKVPVLVVSATYTGKETIQATTAAGGTAFLALPVDPAVFVSKVQSLLSGRAELERQPVLIVEDSVTQARILESAFAGQGYETVVCHTGREAREKFKRVHPQILVLDYHLPDVEGDELVEYFGGLDPQPVIVMITADPDPLLALRWVRKGAAAYLRKPLAPEFLVQTCENALRERSLLSIEQRFVQNQAQYRAIVSYSPLISYLLDTSGTFLLSEGRGLARLGLKPGQMVGQSAFEIYKDIPDIITGLRRALNGETSCYRVKVGDAVFDNWCEPLRDDQGNIQGMIGVAIDVTAQDRAEQQMRDSNELFRTLFEHAPYSCALTDNQHRYLDVNRAFEESTEFSRDQVIGKTGWEVGILRETETAAANRQKVSAGERLGPKEVTSFTASGAQKTQIVRVTPVIVNQEQLIIAATLDITQLKQTEQQLRETNRALRTLSDCNQILVKSEDEAQLLTDICQTLVNVGDYGAAWMGMFEDETQGSLHVTAAVGEYVDLVAGRHVCRPDRMPSNGMIARSLCNRTTSVCRAGETGLECGACPAAALLEHYSVAVALPIMMQERLLGMLTVYGADHRTITPEECKLLEELAGDVAYGVTSLRIRADHARAERQVRESEGRLHSLFDNMAEGVALHELLLDDAGKPVDYRLVDVNARYEEILHLKRADVVGKLGTDVYGTEVPPYLAEFGSVALSGKPAYLDTYFPPLDRYFVISIAPWGQNGFATIFADVTDRIRAETALRESQRTLSTLMGNLPGMAYRCRNDAEWTMEFVSEGCLDLTGYPSEDLLNNRALTFNDLILPEHQERVWNCVQTALQHRTHFLMDYPIRAADGTIKWVWEQGCGVFDGEGRLIALEGFIADISDRKHVEEQLLESQRQIKDIAANVPGVIYQVEIQPDGNILFLYLSERALELLGDSNYTTPDYFDRILTILEESYRKEFIESLERAISTESRWEFEGRYRRPDGELRWFQIMSVPQRSGDRLIYTGVFFDTTERKRAEDELRASEEKFRSIAEQLTDVLYMTDVEGIITYVSPASEKVFGVTQREMQGCRFTDYLVESEIEKAMSVFWQAKQTGQPVHSLALSMKRKDGWTFFGEVDSTLMIRDGEIVGTLGVVRDVTERHKADEAQRLSEHRLRQVIDLVPHFIFAKDIEGRFILVNRAVADAYGTTVERLTGRTDAEFAKSEEEARHFREGDMAVIRSGERIDIPDEVITDAGGRVRHLSTVKIPFTSSGATLPAILGVSVDITDRKHVELERERLEEQLRQSQKLESIGQLAGGIAHDFNNMLTPIIGYAQMFQYTLSPDHPYQGQLEQIVRAAERAGGLTRQLLAFARKQTLEMKPLALNNVVTDFRKMLRRTIRENVSIETQFAETLPLFEGDIGQIEQILLNLCINAQDAMMQGGMLNIMTRSVEVDEPVPAIHEDIQPGWYVCLVVTDNGSGMSAETIGHIFEPFFTTKEVGRGTGLGLATVYGIVKQHNGYVRVISEIGKGSTFEIYFPATAIHAEFTEHVLSPEVIHHGRETVLLAEDQEQVRDLAVEILEMYGYKVLAADNGAAALALAGQTPDTIDLLVSDVIMPDMNGRQLYEKLSVSRPGLKVLYISGYSQDVIGHQGVLHEGINFLQKPFSVQSFVNKVRQVLDHKEDA